MVPVVESIQGRDLQAKVLAALHIPVSVQPLTLGASVQGFRRPAVRQSRHHLEMDCQVECDFVGTGEAQPAQHWPVLHLLLHLRTRATGLVSTFLEDRCVSLEAALSLLGT